MEASAFKPGGSAVPTTQVEIAVSCRNLVDMDLMSKSDPMCVLYVKQFASEQWREIGMTGDDKSSIVICGLPIMNLAMIDLDEKADTLLTLASSN